MQPEFVNHLRKQESIPSLTDRYDNPISTQFLAPIDCSKISAERGIDSCETVLRIRIRRIRMFLGLLDPDPFVKGMDSDPSITKQK
jgi:hypothetical protein